MKASKEKRAVVIRYERGERVDLGNGSFSNLILTNASLSMNSCMLGHSVFKPGINTRQKVHVDSDEYAFIISGSGKLTMGKEMLAYSQGDSIFIPAGVPHGVWNDAKEDVVMLFFFPSPNYPKTTDAP